MVVKWDVTSRALYSCVLVSWCLTPSQPQRIKSGLRENFINRRIIERTNKAEIRLEEQSERVESCWENSWNGHKDEIDTRTE